MRHCFLRSCCATILLLLGAASPGQTTGPSSAPAATPPIDPVYAQAARDFGTALARNDEAAIRRFVDFEAILAKATADVAAPPAHREAFLAFARNDPWGVVPKVRPGETHRLLRVHQQGNEVRVLVRTQSPGGVLSYKDWILAKDPRGKITAIDCDVLAAGELASDGIRRVLQVSLPGKLRGVDGVDVAVDPKLVARFEQAKRTGESAGVLAAYSELPPAVQKLKAMMLVRLMAAERVTARQPEVMRDALADFQKAYPDDPALLLWGTEYWLGTGDYDKVYAAIDKLEKLTDGDPLLKARRAIVMLREGKAEKLAEADKLAHAAQDAESTLLVANEAVVSVLAREGKFEEAVMLLRDMDSRGMTLQGIEQRPLLAELVKSGAYQRWQQSK